MTTETTKTITVIYDADEERLVARCDQDHTLNSNVVKWSDPITAKTDSWAVARAVTEINFAEIVAVDHDGDTIFVHVDGSVCE